MISRIVATIALSTATIGVLAAPGHAVSKPDPCKLLKPSEIAQQFDGATVAAGKKGLATSVSRDCEFAVDAAGDQSAGEVVVRVTTTGAKATFAGIPKVSTGYAPVPGLANSLWSDSTKALSVLKGAKLVTIQPLFTKAGDTRTGSLDTKVQAVALMKLAQKRL